MCFSPEASFAVAGALAPVGAYCVRAAWRKNRRLLALAVVPLLLAAQQAAEGVVWLGLHHEDATLVRRASLVFLFFALAVWPFWFHLVAAVAEPRPGRRALLIGSSVLATGWFWVLYDPLLADPDDRLRTAVAHHSIRYDYTVPVHEVVPEVPLRVLYLLSLIGPLLAGPRVIGLVPGLLLAGAAGLAAAVYAYAFVSVWCFFAAVLSALLGYVFATYRPPAVG